MRIGADAYQTVDVEYGKVRAWITTGNQGLIWDLILPYVVDRRGVLLHLFRDSSVVIGLSLPVLGVSDAHVRVIGIERRQV